MEVAPHSKVGGWTDCILLRKLKKQPEQKEILDHFDLNPGFVFTPMLWSFQSLRPRDIRFVLISLRATFKVELYPLRNKSWFISQLWHPGVDGEGREYGKGRVAGKAGLEPCRRDLPPSTCS